MNPITNFQLLVGAWPDTLSEFVRGTRRELLIASPWITAAAASLIARELRTAGPVTLQILARMDERDFMCGSSHVLAFREATYGANIRVSLRALPMLHAKMLVADREAVIVGSANLTEGGLFRNHEISIKVTSPDIAATCAEEFFRLWSMGSQVPDGYLDSIESAIQDAMPPPDVSEESENPPPQRKARRNCPRFKYIAPPRASLARVFLRDTSNLPPNDIDASEDRDSALDWLYRKLHFLSAIERVHISTAQRIERLMYHPDVTVRAAALDRAGRSGNRYFLPRLLVLATNTAESQAVRSAATFALGILGSPEAFSTLCTLISDESDVGRWSRRGCFLLINEIDDEAQSFLLQTLHVNQPKFVIALAKECDVGGGTVAERLTKALIVEQIASGRWQEQALDKLVCLMMLAEAAIGRRGKKPNLHAVAKYASVPLSVASGDLRHGPLSPSLLQKRTSDGQFTNFGLETLIGEIWRRYQTPGAARNLLFSLKSFDGVLRVLEDAESNKHRDRDRGYPGDPPTP